MVAEDGALTNRQTLTAVSDPASGPYTFGCDLDDDNIVDESTDGEWIAMNYITWMDLCAYADWAALRPLTELEFEKACRGVGVTPLANEYTWGTATIAGSAYTLSNSGQATEEINANYSTSAGNCSYDTTDGSINGPLRVGIFAGDSSNDGTRRTSGSGYYGNMELSGNVFEWIVSLGHSTGRAFLGTHGNGELNSTGNADIADWPGYDGDDVTAATGSGFRGGSWSGLDEQQAEISARYAAATISGSRYNDISGRLTRTAP
jgi:formylglycine-generating enzyme required for sulfatase activity